MQTTSGKIIILTGAGFSKNFGGFLGSEMWGQIFNNKRIQDDSDLRSVLQDDYDYESVYSKVIDSKLPKEKKDVMRDVMLEAYGRLDDILREWVFNDRSPYPVNRYLLSDLFTRIQSTANHSKTFFFTLNQDLFMERHWNWFSLGVKGFKQNSGGVGTQSLDAGDFLELPEGDAGDLIKKGLENHQGIHYVKLHGSYGWKSSDGSNQLVVGTSKESVIQKESLLREYLNLFKNVIAEGEKKILIIGYGFRDAHINAILSDGVANHGLEIYILSTQSPSELRYSIEHGNYFAKNILDDGLRGYFQRPLVEIFPKSQMVTPHYKEILKMFEV